MTGNLPPDDSSPTPLVGPRSIPAGPRRPLDSAGVILAAAWLALPAIQYFGAFQRTMLLTEGSAPQPQFATLDLTTLYLVLLAVTLVLALMRWLFRADLNHTPDAQRGGQPEALS
jgi:hypothetical protein